MFKLFAYSLCVFNCLSVWAHHRMRKCLCATVNVSPLMYFRMNFLRDLGTKKFKPFTPVTVQAGFEQDFFALYHCIVFEGSKLHHN